MLIFPIIAIVLKMAVVIYSSVLGASLVEEILSHRSNQFNFHSANQIVHLATAHSEAHWTYAMLIFSFIAFVWTQLIISGVIQMAVAGTVSTWYWTANKTEMPTFPLATSLKTTLKYHLGTIALGSLTINLCQIPRVFLSICMNEESCFRYTVSYLEKFLRQFNRNAYIVCAMHGKPLRSSGTKAYKIILPNFLHYFGLNLMAGTLFVTSKLLLVIGTVVVGYLSVGNPNVAMYSLVIYGAYFTASSFFSVYSMAVDTLTLCFCEYFFTSIFEAAKPLNL